MDISTCGPCGSICVLTVLLMLLHADFVSGSKYRQRKTSCMSQPSLVCVVQPTIGNTIRGNVTFAPRFAYDSRRGRAGFHVCMVDVRASLAGLPEGLHGFHIHTFGDLRDPSGASTGPHFTNPRNEQLPHGLQTDRFRHWGDLGNIRAHENGSAHLALTDRIARIPAIVGRAITVHAGPDKGSKFQPSGDAGSRIGFCVIGIANTDSFPNSWKLFVRRFSKLLFIPPPLLGGSAIAIFMSFRAHFNRYRNCLATQVCQNKTHAVNLYQNKHWYCHLFF